MNKQNGLGKALATLKAKDRASYVFPKSGEVTQQKVLAIPHAARAVWQLSHFLLIPVMAHCRPPAYITLMTISKRKYLNSAKAPIVRISDANNSQPICDWCIT